MSERHGKGLIIDSKYSEYDVNVKKVYTEIEIKWKHVKMFIAVNCG